MRLMNLECECRLWVQIVAAAVCLKYTMLPSRANWSVTWQWLLALASLSVLAWLDE